MQHHYRFDWNRESHIRGYARRLDATQSLFFVHPPWVPPTENLEGEQVGYPSRELERLSLLERQADASYWPTLARRLVEGSDSPREIARRIGDFVGHALFFNPIVEPCKVGPIAMLEAHDGRCGNAAHITAALLQAAGLEARVTGVHHHVVAEAHYDGAWHLADSIYFGGNQPHRDGVVPSVEEMKRTPLLGDGFEQSLAVYHPETLTSADGWQIQGYVLGPWGSYPYYSWYFGAAAEHPPTLPQGLPAQRLGQHAVRLHWTPSVKRGGGEIEYEVRIYNDRACTQLILRQSTTHPHFEFETPRLNWMYFVRVRAMDAHRRKNPDTWYPPGQWNFALVPEDQYGWYGLL